MPFLLREASRRFGEAVRTIYPQHPISPSAQLTLRGFILQTGTPTLCFAASLRLLRLVIPFWSFQETNKIFASVAPKLAKRIGLEKECRPGLVLRWAGRVFLVPILSAL